MQILFLSENRNYAKYGKLVSFLQLYSKQLESGVCQMKTLKELALEFYGSDDKKHRDSLRVTINRLNRKERLSKAS